MKRKIWVTAGIAAALAFLIAFGAVGCVVSGFDLPLDSYAKVVLICGAASVFCAAAFSLKWGGAAVLCAHILPNLAAGREKRVLFIATGALMSQATFLQGESIPGIAHCVELTSGEETP